MDEVMEPNYFNAIRPRYVDANDHGFICECGKCGTVENIDTDGLINKDCPVVGSDEQDYYYECDDCGEWNIITFMEVRRIIKENEAFKLNECY